MKIFYFVCFMMITVNLNLYAQKYPKMLSPGNVQVNYTVGDTLWVITNKQFNNTINAAIDLKYCDSLLTNYQEKCRLEEEKNQQKSQQIIELQNGYDHYKEIWEQTDKKLENTEIDYQSEKKWKYIFGAAGAALGLIAGLLM